MDFGMNVSAMCRNTNWRGAPLVLAVLTATLAVSPVAAQAPAWPGDSPANQPQNAAPAWPGEMPSQPAARPQIAPAAASPPPMMSPMGPPPSMSPPGGGMGMAPPPNDKQQNCVVEFNRLRGDLDKKGAVAKGISNNKGSREDLCKAVTVMFAAETKWYNYAKSNASVCGIPGDIIKQMGGGHSQVAKMKTAICNGGATAGAGAPRAPSLSEALGTSSLPTQDNTTVRRGGTLDTLTGNPIR